MSERASLPQMAPWRWAVPRTGPPRHGRLCCAAPCLPRLPYPARCRCRGPCNPHHGRARSCSPEAHLDRDVPHCHKLCFCFVGGMGHFSNRRCAVLNRAVSPLTAEKAARFPPAWPAAARLPFTLSFFLFLCLYLFYYFAFVCIGCLLSGKWGLAQGHQGRHGLQRRHARPRLA